MAAHVRKIHSCAVSKDIFNIFKSTWVYLQYQITMSHTLKFRRNYSRRLCNKCVDLYDILHYAHAFWRHKCNIQMKNSKEIYILFYYVVIVIPIHYIIVDGRRSRTFIPILQKNLAGELGTT